MADDTLRNCRILLAEDEYVVAFDLCSELEREGAVVLGPVSSVQAATAVIEAEEEIDGAVLDINLHGQMIFPVADLLAKRSVPFIFATGYDDVAIPEKYDRIIRCEKPVNVVQIRNAIAKAMTAF